MERTNDIQAQGINNPTLAQVTEQLESVKKELIEQQRLLQVVRRENEQRSLELQQVSANCQQLLQQQKRQDAFVFRVAYKRSGKPFFDVKCLVCRGADKTTMLGMYLDLTNKGFHCE